MTDQHDAVLRPLKSVSTTVHSAGYEKLLSMTVYTSEDVGAPVRQFVTGPTILFLIDRQEGLGQRSVAEVSWVEERMSSDLRLVVVWPMSDGTMASAFPTRPTTVNLFDRRGELGKLLAPTGSRRAWLATPETRMLTRLLADSDVFSTTQDWLSTNRLKSDRVIDLGDVLL